ncbi:hypothetical protein OG342_06765 [Streptomyces bobili]|uniref:hypothetical protein n=1 Tax=Streptomyces bobili TaxID=67280 RepID=UPI00224C9D94|nr:hypothetical protein [Streptomyces bobili]MCX5522564.1 hypothetical protein [Streptomyces bobili]
MDEPRDTPPPAESGPRLPLATANSRLSPVQQAYAAYTGHAIACPACRDVDRTCPDAGELWTAYRAISDDAYAQLAEGTRSRNGH